MKIGYRYIGPGFCFQGYQYQLNIGLKIISHFSVSLITRGIGKYMASLKKVCVSVIHGIHRLAVKTAAFFTNFPLRQKRFVVHFCLIVRETAKVCSSNRVWKVSVTVTRAVSDLPYMTPFLKCYYWSKENICIKSVHSCIRRPPI